MTENVKGRRISIDPITRLEGHGRIEIFLDEAGDVDKAYLQLPDLRGFEKFVEGRPAEEMPQITSRICGVCPGAHHMAATRALDALFRVEPTTAAKVIRADIYPIKIPDGGPALDILKPFQIAMVESPPPWLLKVLGVAAEKRLKNYNAAEIDE